MSRCRDCKADAEPGRSWCATHLLYHSRFTSAWRQKRLAVGLCVCGSEVEPGRARCRPCLDASAARVREWKRRQKLARLAAEQKADDQ